MSSQPHVQAFHDIAFPFALALGARGGPERRTDIVTLASGREARNTPWAHARRRWDVGVAITTHDALHALTVFFEARRGSLCGFRFRDPIDFKSCAPSGVPSPHDQPLGVGDGQTVSYQLMKRYGDAGAYTDREIRKPVAGSVLVAIDGVASTAFSLNATTGMVTFDTAPAPGAGLTAGFVFDTPVRFDIARLELSLDTLKAGDAPSVPLIEIEP